MFCPVCRDEFREGFTRCEDCDADLVVDLDMVPVSSIERPGAAAGASAPPPSTATGEEAMIRMTHLCGFLTLEETREARDQLHHAGILSEILIREAPGGDPDRPVEEEFWLRVDHQRQAEAIQVLELDAE